MGLKKEDLVELKQDILKQSDNGKKSRIVLTGDKPIMLATTIFTETEDSMSSLKIMEYQFPY